MAEKPKPEGEEKAPAKGGGMLPWIAITLVCGGLGVAIPFLMPVAAKPPTEEEIEAKKPVFELPKPEETVDVPFDAVVVNLDEGQLTRYLRVAIALQIAKKDEIDFKAKLEGKKAVLKNWLLNQISDKDLEEIRGAAGQNRLRREIRDQFNTVLFPDGFDRIYDVLFDEYNVQ